MVLVYRGAAHLYRAADFQILRKHYSNGKKLTVPGGKGLMAYGRIDVRGVPDFSKCGVRMKIIIFFALLIACFILIPDSWIN